MDLYKSFATELAEKAGTIIRKNFSLEVKREWKDDNSPITATDEAINQMVIDAVKSAFPDHSILAEEGSALQDDSEYTWVCDPIDGTTPFSVGIPFSSFCLALTKKGESILGVIYDPYMQRMYVAEKGKGSFLNGNKIHVSNSPDLRKGYITVDGIKPNAYDLNVLYNAYFTHGVHFLSFKSSSLSGSFVASGNFMGVVFGNKHAWDGAAVKIIVEEAGGKVTDLFGNEQRYDKDIKGFVASNGRVHDQLLLILDSSRRKKQSIKY